MIKWKSLMRLLPIIFLLLFLRFPAASAETDPITSLTNELTHHIVTVLREMSMDGVNLDEYCTSCSQEMHTRHIFIRAYDIDQHLSSFLKMHGEEVPETPSFEYKTYTSDDLLELLMRIDRKLEFILAANEIPVDHSRLKNLKAMHRDHYAVLDRIDHFVLSIGSPSIRPADVLQRAHAIRQIVQSLCHSEVCPDTQYSPSHLLTPKMPIHVYREVNRLTSVLNRYVKQFHIQIENGITTLARSKEIITPRIVNKASGVLLADLIEIRSVLNNSGSLSPPADKANVTPTDVWRELNFARRYLEDLTY